MKKVILNFGCGKTRIPKSIGIDNIKIKDYVDIVYDLNRLPYSFNDNSIDEVHMYHVLEHLETPLKKIEEIYRILKPGGVLHLRVPHFSSMGAFSDITHIRPFGYTSFDIFERNNYHNFYAAHEVQFKILFKEIKYSGLYPNKGTYEKYIHKNESPLLARPFVHAINFLIKLSPIFFERIWCYWVGGATEIVIDLQKVKKN